MADETIGGKISYLMGRVLIQSGKSQRGGNQLSTNHRKTLAGDYARKDGRGHLGKTKGKSERGNKGRRSNMLSSDIRDKFTMLTRSGTPDATVEGPERGGERNYTRGRMSKKRGEIGPAKVLAFCGGCQRRTSSSGSGRRY